MVPPRVRKDPLGPQTLNQLQDNAWSVDSRALAEHASNGKHNTAEVPFVLGHMVDGAPPTGYLFDTAFGGTTLARPATGRYTCSVVGGVVSTSPDSLLEYSAMASVSDSAIESKPHTITVEAVSAMSFQYRVRELSSALGAGNAWGDKNRNIDVAIHANPQPASASLIFPHVLDQRRGFLTHGATDWNALVQNQGIIRKASLVEHTSSGEHLANRIAKGVGWFRPIAGPGFDITASQGVASVSRVSLGVVEVVMKDNFTALTTMACFPEGQPAGVTTLYDELLIVNGRGFGTGAGTSKFRFYLYGYSAGNWARVDRPFFAAMFGVIA